MIRGIVSGEVKRADHRSAGTKDLTELAICRVNGKPKDGEQPTFTWVKINVWDAPDWMANQLVKGAWITAIGDLTLRKYQAKDGTEKHTLEMRCSSFDIDVMKAHATEEQPAQVQKPVAPAKHSETDAADPPF